jgi:glutathionylspermidine synthase
MQVKKPIFGREGSDVCIIDENGNTIEEQRANEYDNHKMIYQEYTQLPTDSEGNSYQSGVFFAYEACGVGFRRGSKIINNMSKFVGHIIEE